MTDDFDNTPKIDPKTLRIGGAIAAVGTVIAASTIFLGGGDGDPLAPPSEYQTPPVEAEDLAPRTADADVSTAPAAAFLCHPAVVKGGDGCVPIGARIMPVTAASELVERPLTMVGPGDSDERQVSNCQDYTALAAEGWGGLTTADMRREARLVQACGFTRLAAKAGRVENASRLTTQMMEGIDKTMFPSLGELTFSSDAVLVQEDEGPARWSIDGETLEGSFLLIGTADFDGDREAEHLLEWRVTAKGGSLGALGYGFVEDGPSFRVIDPFAL